MFFLIAPHLKQIFTAYLQTRNSKTCKVQGVSLTLNKILLFTRMQPYYFFSTGPHGSVSERLS